MHVILAKGGRLNQLGDVVLVSQMQLSHRALQHLFGCKHTVSHKQNIATNTREELLERALR